MPETITTYFWLCLSAVLAGAMNAVAGGGTLLTFPALLNVISPVAANATSTVALVPGSIASAWGYRKETVAAKRWLLLLAWPSLIGGIIGSLLVSRLDERIFSALVPWLILVAALLFLAQPTIAKLTGVGHPHQPATLATLVAVTCFQFLVAVYGGYFGAGIGILMLSALGIMGLSDIHEMNALKTILAFLINGVSVCVFILHGRVEWNYALAMAVAAIVGGYAGARIARRLNRNLVRWIVIAIGFGLAGHFFYKQWNGG